MSLSKPKRLPPKLLKAEPPPLPGKLLIMSPADRAWNDNDAAGAAPETASEPSSGKRRMSAMAAVVALAAVAGALGGALATAGLGYMMGGTSEVAKCKPARSLRWRGSTPTSWR